MTGVEIVFPPQKCTFTLAEAAAGIDFDFVITIAAPIADVTPTPGDAGQCEPAGPSGLITFIEVVGGGEHYCICDQGLCGPGGTPVDLVPGDFQGTFSWPGVNWDGPSDTDEPYGRPFPPGLYEVRVYTRGSWAPMGADEPFEVLGALPIVLVP